LGKAGTEIFLQMGLDSLTTEQPDGQISRQPLVPELTRSAGIKLNK
jgi:hypothetical protein